MILTNDRTTVTIQMLHKENMIRGYQIGVPVDIKDLKKGLQWKEPLDLTKSDYYKIEQYFIDKS